MVFRGEQAYSSHYFWDLMLSDTESGLAKVPGVMGDSQGVSKSITLRMRMSIKRDESIIVET
jgi:hypothetical protein